VPGRTAKRNGLRRPYAHTREHVAVGLPFQYGLLGSPWPVSLSTRRILPHELLMLCERNAPMSSDGSARPGRNAVESSPPASATEKCAPSPAEISSVLSVPNRSVPTVCAIS